MVQKYVSQPNTNGKYDVARFNDITCQYEVIEPGYPMEKQAQIRASELNNDEKEYNHDYI